MKTQEEINKAIFEMFSDNEPVGVLFADGKNEWMPRSAAAWYIGSENLVRFYDIDTYEVITL